MTENTAVQTYNPEDEALVAAPAAPITPMQMLEIAVNKGADIDQLNRLMDLHERWEESEARKAFVAAKAAFKAEAPTLTKNKKVGFTSKKTGDDTEYWHATLDHVADTLGPVLSKHGLSYSWETEQLEGGMIRVTCVLTHVMGHSEKVSLQAGADQSGKKNNIQAIGSTVSYLERYTLLAATGMATKGQDDDGAGADHSEPISEAQKNEIIELIKETGADSAAFLKYLGYVSVDAIPVSMFDRAINALNKKREQQA